MARAELASLLYQALGEPIGLLLRTSDFAKARQQLYAARAQAGDPALAVLQFRASPFPDGDLVICRGGTLALPQAQEELEETA